MRWSARSCHLGLVVLSSIAVAGGGSCTPDASVRIRISAPADTQLSPLDDRLALVSMQVTGPDFATQIQSRPVVRGESIDLGEVPFADDLTITLAASDSAGRLLGYGRSDRTIDISEGSSTEVTVRLRRPFSYLIGGPTVTALDPTFDITQPYRRELSGAGAAVAIAVPADGKDLVVVADGAVRLVDTATHAPVEGVSPMGITAGARDAMVSPDSKWLVISHATGVTLALLADVRKGSASPQFFPVGAASAIAFSAGRAWVLVNGASVNCPSAPSSLVAIDLDGRAAGAVTAMGTAIADLAADSTTGLLLAATPCEAAVKRVDIGGSAPVLADFLGSLPLATAVVAMNGRVWALGAVDAKVVQVPDPTDMNGGTRPDTDGTAHLVLVTADELSGTSTAISLPIPEELAKGTDIGLDEVPGQSAEVRMGADAVRPVDLAVLPDGSRLAVLWNASYDSIFFGDAPFIGTVISTLTLTTSEYQLLDAATGAPLQRLRTRCNGEVVQPDGFLKGFVCVQSPGQDVLGGTGYAPKHVAVLFGER
jgi:hypothetical protein